MSRSQGYTIQLQKHRESVTRNRIDFKLVVIFFVRDVGCDDGSRSLEHVPEIKIKILSMALNNIIGPRRSTQSVGFKTVPLFKVRIFCKVLHLFVETSPYSCLP